MGLDHSANDRGAVQPQERGKTTMLVTKKLADNIGPFWDDDSPSRDRAMNAKDRLIRIYNQTSDVTRIAGATWYDDAFDEALAISRRFGFAVTDVVFAIAALSPRNPWNRNLSDTEAVARAVYNKTDLPAVGLKRNVTKAVNALRGDSNGLSGPKVTAFARAILGDTTAVVLDVWMLRAMGWDKKYFPKAKQYDALAAELTDAAVELGVAPAHLQATVWLAVRSGAVNV